MTAFDPDNPDFYRMMSNNALVALAAEGDERAYDEMDLRMADFYGHDLPEHEGTKEWHEEMGGIGELIAEASRTGQNPQAPQEVVNSRDEHYLSQPYYPPEVMGEMYAEETGKSPFKTFQPLTNRPTVKLPIMTPIHRDESGLTGWQHKNASEPMDAFDQAWGIVKMPLVRDSIKDHGEGNFTAEFQDPDDPDKQYQMRTHGGDYHWPRGLNVNVSGDEGEGTVAFGNFRNYDPSWHPSNVKTRESHRRKGIMTGIYDLVNEIARRRGDPGLHTNAGNLNDYSAPFWAKHLGLPIPTNSEEFNQFQRDHGRLNWPEEGVFE